MSTDPLWCPRCKIGTGVACQNPYPGVCVRVAMACPSKIGKLFVPGSPGGPEPKPSLAEKGSISSRRGKAPK